jgi:putative membrane protein insertion efficiency factor
LIGPSARRHNRRSAKINHPSSRPAMSLYERSVRLGHRAYKLTLSPWIGGACRFQPTCSDYAAEALVQHGPVRGSWLAARRLCRCHPFGGSGFDPVPPRPDRKGGTGLKCET